MAKVTIHYKNGDVKEVNASPEEEAYYDNLPFTDDNVVSTKIRTGR